MTNEITVSELWWLVSEAVDYGAVGTVDLDGLLRGRFHVRTGDPAEPDLLLFRRCCPEH